MNLQNTTRTYVLVRKNDNLDSVYGYVITSGLAYHILAYAVDEQHAERVVKMHGWVVVQSHDEARERFVEDQKRARR